MNDPRRPSTSFFGELRRRRVVRTATVYAVVGWAVTEIASTVAPVLLLPEWFPRAVVLLVLLGFPIALALAWAFDVTPAGIRRTGGAGEAGDAAEAAPPAGAAPGKIAGSPAGKPAGPGPHPYRYGAIGALIMLVLTAGYLRISAGERGANGADDAPEIRSMAVLPFLDMSPEGDQEYFSDGVSEELLNVLSRLPGLQVAARTSSFAFKGRNENVGEIGRQLNVEAVLEGSVRRDGSRIRVTAQLIDARTGYHLWSENYDRELSSVLMLQDEIAHAIVEALRLRIAGGARDDGADPGARGAVPGGAGRAGAGAAGPAGRFASTGLGRSSTIDPETHGLYLRGLHHWHRRRVEDFHRAIDYFQQAIDRDPGYAAAHAGLALSRITLTGYDNSSLDEMLPLARAAARRALELDPELADAHAALSLVARREGDWNATERHCRSALEINPNHVTAHHWLSQHLVAMGGFDEALALARRALELDPLSIIINNNVGFIHGFRRETEAAARAYAATVELDPSFPTALGNLWHAYRVLGRYDDALDALDMMESTAASGPVPLYRAVTRGLSDPALRPAALDALAESGRRPGVSTYHHATLYAELGELEAALDWLDRAHENRHYNMPYIAVAPQFVPLHGHPRFEALIQAMNLTHVRRVP